MSTNAYESAVIINAALDDEQIETIISRIKDTVISNGGEIRNVDNWGRKRLAYMVNKSKIGFYAVFIFNAPSNIISKLERFYQLDENIIRYLTIKLDSDALEYLEQNKVNPAIIELESPPVVADIVAAVEEIEDDSAESDK